MKLPLATTTWDECETKALHDVIDSGMFSMGKYVKSFEEDFANFVGSRHCVMVNSGSSANLLAVAALFYCKDNPLQRGDEVIVPAVSWSTTYFPLYQYGLKLKFVDIDKETLNLDLEQLESAISEKTRAIFSVNLLGNPVDYINLKEIISGKDIRLIEDNCESLGATLNAKQAGTFGVMGSYSTYFSHHMSTMEGGMVVTDDEELFHILLSLRSHGWTRHLPEDNRICDKSDDQFYESFKFVLPGYNLRPLDMSGALGIQQLKKLPDIVKGRRKNAQIFQQLFSDIPGLAIQQETGESSWFGFALIVENGRNARDELVKRLTENEVECRPVVAGNFIRNPVVKYLDYSVHRNLTNSDLVNDCAFFIGNHHFDISDKLRLIADLTQKTL